MRGKNPAWVIPISDEQQIATANLSAAVIRRHSSEPLVALVSKCLKPTSIEEGGQNSAEKTRAQLWNSNVHPLLGRYVSSGDSLESEDELGAEHRFQNLLHVERQAPYLAAHVIGSELIFPGAAHLELVLAATNFQGDAEMPLVVNNFEIHQPLHLPSNSGRILRTSMSHRETGWNIVVESQPETESCWRRCASAEVLSGQLQLRQQLYLDELKERLVVAAKSSSFYEKLDKLGLNFGKEFKSLGNIRQSDSGNEVVAEVGIPEDAAHYVCHPLLADAMLQCFIFSKQHAEQLTTLVVPVGVKKFVCHRRLRPSECTGAASATIYFNDKEQTVLLLDSSSGTPIASMTEPQFKATTVSSILAAAGCPLKKTRDGELDIYQVDWKPATKYQSEGSLRPGLDFTQSPSFSSLLRTLERRNVFLGRDAELFSQVVSLAELFVYKAFHELGWTPKIGESVLVSDLATDFHIAANFLPAFRYFFSYFEKSGVLKISGKLENTRLKVLQLPRKREMIEKYIAQLLEGVEDYEPIRSVVACASQLAPVMQGKVKGEQILFEPGEGGVTHADIIYRNNTFYKNSANAAPKLFFEIASQLWQNEAGETSKRRLRVLEVGGGTGVFTREAIQLLNGEGIEYSYHFTDISSQFLKKAASRFPHLIYKTLDLEKDPLEQGFPPAYFDIVVGLDVLHATKNLRKSVAHLRMVMKTGAHLLLGETNKPMKEADVTFGILDGYWHFEDHDVRLTHCTISAEQWLSLLNESGLRGPCSKVLMATEHLCVVVGTLSHPLAIERVGAELKTWILLHNMDEKQGLLIQLSERMRALGRNLVVLNAQAVGDLGNYSEASPEGILCLFQGESGLASSNCRSILEPLLLASKWMIERKGWSSVPRLVVATSGLWKEAETETSPSLAALWGFVRSARMELPWLISKLVDLDPDIKLELRIESLLQEMWMGDDETEAVYRLGVRYTRRLMLATPETNNLLPIPNNSKDYTIQLPTSNLIQDLLYIPKTTEKLSAAQVIVEVRAVALNFRDVFSVLKPSERFKDLTTIGMDFSGVVSSVGSDVKKLKVGTPVFGISFDKTAISGYISISAQNLCEVPVGLSFGEAATLPVAFLTAWHCIVNVAHACSGQTILIHAASGGVGLVAIQIAKHLDLNIIATAGSQRKRNFLRNLDIPHVYNSRTLEFGQKIQETTNGQGVDIVLNCLTGPGFKEASLEVCKIGGHFVEISKLDIWEKNEVQARKPRVHYEVVDLSGAESGLLTDSLAQLSWMLLNSSLKPIPYTRFTASKIVSALRFLQNAKHIGKVVVEMPTFDMYQNRFKDRLFNEGSTYLITGGKGAIGLAIAEWMVSKGAKYLVLLGRSPPKGNALQLIQKLEEEAGGKVVSMEADVADFDEMKRVLEDIEENVDLPPLRGVHHCAGVLSDDMVVNQDWASFEYSLNPKVKGSYNLHLLTRQSPLEFFVVHSSLTCVLGNPGQSNHSAGCLYTESLMESRVENGLPGMSISWGHWDAGLAANREVETLTAFTIPQGIAALNKFFMENMSCGGAGFMTPSKLCGIFPAYEKTFLETILLENRVESGRQTERREEKFSEIYEEVAGDEQLKMDCIRKLVKNMLCDTLGITFQEVGEQVQFVRMGLDSLMSIEFYNKLQSAMGKVELGYIDMQQYGTVEQVSTIIKTALDSALL